MGVHFSCSDTELLSPLVRLRHPDADSGLGISGHRTSEANRNILFPAHPVLCLVLRTWYVYLYPPQYFEGAIPSDTTREDWALQDLLATPRQRQHSLLLIASSYVTWTYQTHTFSNSVETIAVLWSLVLMQRISRTKVRIDIHTSQVLPN
jgi:hypothetical protein